MLNSGKLYLQRTPRTLHLCKRLALVKHILFLPLSFSGVTFSVFKEMFLSWTLFKMSFKLIVILTFWQGQFSTVILSHPKSDFCENGLVFYVTLKSYLIIFMVFTPSIFSCSFNSNHVDITKLSLQTLPMSDYCW